MEALLNNQRTRLNQEERKSSTKIDASRKLKQLIYYRKIKETNHNACFFCF